MGWCKRTLSSSILLITIIHLFIITQHECSGISCFTCSSRNGSNTDCEDPFNSTQAAFTERCKVPKRGRSGEFPAHFCIKMIGISYKTREKLTVRRCVLENMDNQCSEFNIKDKDEELNDERFKGCILTCAIDGCNSSNSQYSSTKYITLMIPLLILFAYLPTWSTVSNYLVSQEDQSETTKESPGTTETRNTKILLSHDTLNQWLLGTI